MNAIGYIGLGKMGKNMVLRLHEKGWRVFAYNRNPQKRRDIQKYGVKTVYNLKELVRCLKPPRCIWLMVSHEAVDAFLKGLMDMLNRGDTVIDGGNSYFKYSMVRAKKLHALGIHYLDVGTSGGPHGARNGACCMIGGDKKIFKKYEILFKDLAAEGGYGYMGKSGAGHFVKMVHNGIEYGMMQAIGEGFSVMKKSKFNLDLKKVAEVYNHRSVIESRLVGWLKSAYEEHGQDLKSISGIVGYTGEGEWTVKTAKEFKIPVPIIEAAFKFRVQSKKKPSYTGKILSALRNQFGGHTALSLPKRGLVVKK